MSLSASVEPNNSVPWACGVFWLSNDMLASRIHIPELAFKTAFA
jgi:hypothetical protein